MLDFLQLSYKENREKKPECLITVVKYLRILARAIQNVFMQAVFCVCLNLCEDIWVPSQGMSWIR